MTADFAKIFYYASLHCIKPTLLVAVFCSVGKCRTVLIYFWDISQWDYGLKEKKLKIKNLSDLRKAVAYC